MLTCGNYTCSRELYHGPDARLFAAAPAGSEEEPAYAVKVWEPFSDLAFEVPQEEKAHFLQAAAEQQQIAGS